MRNNIMKFMGVVGLLLATACADQSDDGTTHPGDGAITLDGCKVAGCNNEACISVTDEIFTACEWREEYACYQTANATCERQSSGVCNWTTTPQLQACLSEAEKK